MAARRAERFDLIDLVGMYRRLTDEQRAIRSIWPDTDGLDEPADITLETLLDTGSAVVVVGTIDGSVLGFLVAVEEPLLAPNTDRRIGVIKLIYTEHDARGVGVGAAMLSVVMSELEGRGIDLFDARVSPGHRMAKNFFEANGFKTRSITMHRSDEQAGPTDGVATEENQT